MMTTDWDKLSTKCVNASSTKSTNISTHIDMLVHPNVLNDVFHLCAFGRSLVSQNQEEYISPNDNKIIYIETSK